MTDVRIIDDWTTPELVRAADAEWPRDDWPHWHRYENGKLATKDVSRFTPAIAETMRRLLTINVGQIGVEDAFGDWNCHGAGMHTMPAGTSLGKHLDSDHHPQGWQRACNAILFVRDSDGDLQFWNDAGTIVVQSIEPRFNRLVLFVPTDTSWHAVAPVATGPRRTLSAFYWRHGSGGERERARFA